EAGERSGHVQRAVEVRMDHVVPDVEVEVDDGDAVLATRGGGVVDDDVDASELVHDLLCEVLHGDGVGDVGNDRQRPPAEGTNLLGDRVDVLPPGGLLLGREGRWVT